MDRELDSDEVSVWIENLKQRDQEAAELLWSRYFEKLVTVARGKLSAVPKRTYDEEDVAASVFGSLCRGAELGNFSRLSDRNDLWALLLAMTRQKTVDRIRHNTRQKRGGGDVRGESIFGLHDDDALLGLQELVAEVPTPDFLVELEEQHQQLLEMLPDDTIRRVALMRMEGHSIKEIAKHFDFTPRWAERKLELIRKQWTAAMADG